MYNPHYPFTPDLLNSFIERGYKYFVRQELKRAKDIFDQTTKGYFIISHYTDLNHAEQHFNLKKHEPYIFLYDWDNEEHKQKLKIAASNPENYKIFSSVFYDNWNKRLTRLTQDKIKNYMKNQLHWFPKRADSLTSSIYVELGDLFIHLKWNEREAKVKFDDIENIK